MVYYRIVVIIVSIDLNPTEGAELADVLRSLKTTEPEYKMPLKCDINKQTTTLLLLFATCTVEVLKLSYKISFLSTVHS